MRIGNYLRRLCLFAFLTVSLLSEACEAGPCTDSRP
jgi:hypothetical protein